MENACFKTLDTEKFLFQELYPCHFGYSICEPGHSFGPAVRPNYILCYVLQGKGCYTIDSRVYTLQAEQGFLIEPNTMVSYQADHAEPWTYVWIGFGGSRAKRLLEQLGLSCRTPTFSADCGAQLLQIVQDMLQCEEGSTAHALSVQSLLCSFFACISRSRSVQNTDFRRQQQNYYVQAAVEYIQENYANAISVQDIANHIGISRSYLTTLFQAVMQIPPSQYLTSFRLSRGKEQLTITDLPISAIADMCGYRDSLIFAKAFKLSTGMTPTQYRKADRKELQLHMRSPRKKKG